MIRRFKTSCQDMRPSSAGFRFHATNFIWIFANAKFAGFGCFIWHLGIRRKRSGPGWNRLGLILPKLNSGFKLRAGSWIFCTLAVVLGCALAPIAEAQAQIDFQNIGGNLFLHPNYPFYDISSLSIGGMVFADQFTGADMCAKANAASVSLGVGGGKVVIRAGTYSCATQITIPANVTLAGQGALATRLNFTAGGDEILMNGVAHASLQNLSVSLPSLVAAVALHMEASTPQTCVYNSVIGVDFSAPSLFAGQFGIEMDGNSCVFNSFHHLIIRNIDQPVHIAGNSEGNHWSDVQANSFAATNSGAGIYAGGNDDQFTGVRCSLGSSVANPIYCVNFVGQFNQADNIFADLGVNGAAITGAGASTQMVSVGAIGSTVAGVVTGGYGNALGRDQNGSSYEVNDLTTTGTNRFLFQAGVSGFSNGFTVDYQDAPHAIRYTFADGPVGFGTVPSFGSAVGAYGSNWAINGAGASWGGGVAIPSSSEVALSGSNGISAGTITLVAGSGSHAFTSAYSAAPACTATDSTAVDAVKVTSTAAAITIAGTGTDVINWVCTPSAN